MLQAVSEGRSYRWIARDLGISKNTVLDIVKRHLKILRVGFCPGTDPKQSMLAWTFPRIGLSVRYRDLRYAYAVRARDRHGSCGHFLVAAEITRPERDPSFGTGNDRSSHLKPVNGQVFGARPRRTSPS